MRADHRQTHARAYGLGMARGPPVLLVSAGYTRCHAMRGGFGGSRDPSGEIIDVGWQGLSYPVDTGNGNGVSHKSLRKRVSSSA